MGTITSNQEKRKNEKERFIEFMDGYYEKFMYIESEPTKRQSKVSVEGEKEVFTFNITLTNIIGIIKEQKKQPLLYPIHQERIINLEYLDRKKGNRDDGSAILKNGKELKVSNSHWQNFSAKCKSIKDQRDQRLYTDISNFHDNVARIRCYEGYGFVSKKGLLIEPIYDNAENLGSGFIRIKEGNNYGIISTMETKLSSFNYQEIRVQFNRRMAAKRNNKYGFLGEAGDGKVKELIPFIYDSVRDFEDGLSLVAYGNHRMIIDRDGRFLLDLDKKRVAECENDSRYTSLHEILAHCYHGTADEISRKRTIGAILEMGIEQLFIFGLKKDFDLDYSNEFYHYEGTDRYYFIGYDAREPLHNLRLTFTAIINREGKIENAELYGFTDMNGNLVIDLKGYEDARFFSYKRARVKKDGKWGIIGEDGNPVVACEYDWINDYVKVGNATLAIATKGGKWGAIDENGNLKVKIEYDRIHPFSEGLACVLSGTKCGFVDETGKVVIPLDYDYRFPNSSAFNEGAVTVSKNPEDPKDQTLFWIDKSGNPVGPSFPKRS